VRVHFSRSDDTTTNYVVAVSNPLDEQCEAVADDQEFSWAVAAVNLRWKRSVGFKLVQVALFVTAFLVADSPPLQIAAWVALLASFVAEDRGADKFIVAGGDQLVLFDMKGFFAARPTSVRRHIAPDGLELASIGMFTDRWTLDGHSVSIGRRHRSSIQRWLAGQTAATAAAG
jgi:hypothetical protein